MGKPSRGLWLGIDKKELAPTSRSLLTVSLYLLATPIPRVDKEESQVGKAEAGRTQGVASNDEEHIHVS